MATSHGHPRPNESTDESLLYLSVLMLGEIRKGAAALQQGKRRTHLETWLEVELQARFAGRIVPVDVAIVDRRGLIATEAKRMGKALPIIDGLLAATASPQSDRRFARRQWFYERPGSGLESVGSVTR